MIKYCLVVIKVINKYKPEIKDFNLWNSETWFFPVETGDLFMFPSSTIHQVETKKGTNTNDIIL
jgi:hypothetical protein